jgi:osmotically-inducible protein OsmY
MQGFFGLAWEAPVNYDVVLNTERIKVDTCVELIAMLVQSPAFAETEASRRALKDRLIEARIRSALGDRLEVGASTLGIDIVVEDGVVTLSGATSARPLIEAVVAETRKVEGVRQVHNRISHLPQIGRSV